MDINSKGKALWIELEGEFIIAFTFGLVGGFGSSDSKSNRIEFVLDDGESFFFKDYKNYGSVTTYSSIEEFEKAKLSKLGVDVLSDWSVIDLEKMIETKKSVMICKFLMDQSKFCGIGNYLKCEILYAAGISPHLLTKDLSKNNIEVLAAKIKEISKNSLSHNGRAYRYCEWIPSTENVNSHLKVYEKKFDDQRNIITKQKTKDRRWTYWVPNIQGTIET